MVLFNRRKYMRTRRSPQGAPIDIADATITIADSVQYTGSPRTPEVTVVYDGATLVVNTDYFVSYNDNTNVGAATAVITGAGEFTGQVVKTFQIVSAASGGDWQFDLDDLPGTIEFSHFANSTHSWYGQICPSRDETRLIGARGSGYYAYAGTWSNFDPSTFVFDKVSAKGVHAGGALYTPDGIHYLMSDYGSNSVYIYVGETEYDPSTIPDAYSSVKNIGIEICGGSISRDGRHLLLSTIGWLYSYDLSTPFDLSTWGNEKRSNVGMAGPIFVNQNNGTQILQTHNLSDDNPTVWVHTLENPWDASSVVASKSATPSIKIGSSTYPSKQFLRGVAVNNAGNKIVLIGSSLNMSSPRPANDKSYAALIDFSA